MTHSDSITLPVTRISQISGDTNGHEPSAELEIYARKDQLPGQYANGSLIHSNRDEMIIDFVMRQGLRGHLVAKIIMSPRQAKGLCLALERNLAKYESRHGPIPESVPGC